jgi:capsular exopolysaccharide synthesis family protein
VGRIFEALEREERERRGRGASEEVWQAPPVPPDALLDIGEPRSARRPLDRHLEQYQALRAGLLSRDAPVKPKVVLFTGTEYGDGVTTTLANLASVLSGAGRRSVLLIDADLRAPQLDKLVSPQRTTRLEEAIAGNGASPVARVEQAALHLVTGCARSAGAAELFQSSGFVDLLALARAAYDYVLIDSPPIQRSTEYWDLARKADGVVLVLRSGWTRRHVALRAKRQIEMAGGRIVGVVLNRRRYYIPGWLYRRL